MKNRWMAALVCQFSSLFAGFAYADDMEKARLGNGDEVRNGASTLWPPPFSFGCLLPCQKQCLHHYRDHLLEYGVSHREVSDEIVRVRKVCLRWAQDPQSVPLMGVSDREDSGGHEQGFDDRSSDGVLRSSRSANIAR